MRLNSPVRAVLGVAVTVVVACTAVIPGSAGATVARAATAPKAPTGLHAYPSSIAGYGAYLAWTPETTSNGFVVTQATNAALTTGRVDRSITGADFQYSPPSLTPGVTYYFRVRARNGSTLSAYSAQEVSIKPIAKLSGIRAMTFNILEANFDGTVEGGQTVASWSARRTVAAKEILQAKPDMVAIQEGAAYISPTGHYSVSPTTVRQVDDLVNQMNLQLGSKTYAVAATEIPPLQLHYVRRGVYIVYNTRTLGVVRPGTAQPIGDTRYGAFQELQVRATGAKFLFASTHLIANDGAHYDAVRQAETTAFVKDALAIATPLHLRVVYGGDFNSDVSAHHSFDGPGRVMLSSSYRTNSARTVSPGLYNAKYNSANQYLRTAIATNDDIDYIYVGPGVPVTSWGVIVNLSNGKFVGTMAADHNPVWASIQIPY